MFCTFFILFFISVYLEYKRKAGRIKRHKDGIIDEYSETGKTAQHLESFNTRKRADADQQNTDKSVQSDGRSQ